MAIIDWRIRMRNMTIKCCIIITLLGILGVMPATALNMYLSTYRYLDRGKNTILLMDYQIPYRSVTFVAKNSAFFAEVAIRLEVIQQDSIIATHDFQDNIGLSSKHDVTSQTKSYLNRIKLLIDQDDYKLRFTAIDTNTNRVYSRELNPRILSPASLLSDVELISVIRADSSRYLEKFRRNGLLFQTEPSQLFDKDSADAMYIYFEIYETANPGIDLYNINLGVSRSGSVVVSKTIDYYLERGQEGLSMSIPLIDLKPGLYNGILDVSYDKLTERRTFSFTVRERTEQVVFLFADEDQEYRLIRYFSAGSQVSDWRNMTPSAKRKFITLFWHNLASTTNQTVDQVLQMIKERVDHSNRFFTHFDPGWTTDMGRIYIRNGAADEIEKGQTSDETRYVRKDYQIWKYTLRRKAVYLFVDIQMNGNYRLMYVSNDDMEFSNPDWRRYLGEDFDESMLRF